MRRWRGWRQVLSTTGSDPLAHHLIYAACQTAAEVTRKEWAYANDDRSELIEVSREGLVYALPSVGVATTALELAQLVHDLWQPLNLWVGWSGGVYSLSGERGTDLARDVELLHVRALAMAALSGPLWNRERACAESREAEELELERERALVAAKEAEYESALNAQNALKAEFEDLSKRERRTANAQRYLASFLLVTLSLVALYLAITLSQAGVDTWGRTAATLGVGLPLLALAGYVAKESNDHRRLSRWARVMAVQLATIQNYVKPLEATQQRELMQTFGHRVLGELPPDAGGSSHNGNLTTALDIIQRFMSTRSS